MNGMALLILVSGLAIVPLVSYCVFKQTVLDVTSPKMNPWPLLWYFDIALVLIPLVIVSSFGVESIPVLFKSVSGTETGIAVVVIVTLIAYIVSLSLFLRLFQFHGRLPQRNTIAIKSRLRKVVLSLSLLGLLLIGSFYLLGYKHAFVTTIVRREPLLQIRLANQYSSRVPSQVQSILWVVGYLLAACGGYLGTLDEEHSLVALGISLFVLAAPGDKAPPIWGLLIWLLARGFLMPRKLISIRSFVYFSVLILCALSIVYIVVSMQMNELTLPQFFRYLVNRLGVGQMAGVYETFGLARNGMLPKGDFYWHMFPGARMFVDYTDYQKVLMMVTEGYGYSEMGVKNTYFIAEAYAIGGVPLLLASPVIVAFSTALGLAILKLLLGQIVGREVCGPVATLLYFKTQSITGGFSHFPLQKGLILISAYLLIIWLFCLIVDGLRKWVVGISARR